MKPRCDDTACSEHEPADCLRRMETVRAFRAELLADAEVARERLAERLALVDAWLARWEAAAR